jgi:hypothetical protein
MSNDLDDDDSHPIPRVDAIDFVRTIVGGGAAYGLVIARPLGADKKSRLRLQKKMDGYVEDFFSGESSARQGTPKPGKMWIYVNIHQDSDPLTFEFIRKCEPWLADNGIALIVNSIDHNGVVQISIDASRS